MLRREFTVIYRGEPVGGVPTTSAESTRVEWVSVDRIPGLTMDPSQRKRIDWASDVTARLNGAQTGHVGSPAICDPAVCASWFPVEFGRCSSED